MRYKTYIHFQVSTERFLQGDGFTGDDPAPQRRIRAEDEPRRRGRGSGDTDGGVCIHQADYTSVIRITHICDI